MLSARFGGLLGVSRRERLSASLERAEHALAAADANGAALLFDKAARLADAVTQPHVRARALLGLSHARRQQGDEAGAALAAADAAAGFSQAGDEAAQHDALAVEGASPLLVGRALALADVLVQKDDAEGFAAVSHGVLKLLWGADAEPTVDVALKLLVNAITLSRPDLAARILFFSAGPLRVLAIREDIARIERITDLAAAALSHARSPRVLDEAGDVTDEGDTWALPLTDLVVELSEPRLDPMRRIRAQLMRARVLLEEEQPDAARDAALIAMARARAAFGDDDAATAEAREVLALADEMAPTAVA